MLEKFFIRNDSFKVDWGFANTIPEFKQLASRQQNPKWHGEGDALQHTLRCLEAAYKHVNVYYTSLWEKRIAVLSVLFHDIGKTTTTEFLKGAWHAYGHEFAGEKLERRILWDEDINIRERICASIRYHMEVLRIADATSDMLKKIVTPTFNKFFSWKDVLFVKLCDIYGSIPDSEDETLTGISKISALENITKELNIYDRYQGWKLPDELYTAAILGKKNIWLKRFKDNWPTVYVMIGLPGSGKNYYIEHNVKDCVTISRDDIRTELGYCAEGDKVVLSSEKEEEVTKVFNERFLDAVVNNKAIILNNINLKKQYRDAYKALLKDNGITDVNWVYIYLEAKDMETVLHRRLIIPFSAYEKMIEGFDWPQPGEYNELIILKSR
jgi:hypothetical protein